MANTLLSSWKSKWHPTTTFKLSSSSSHLYLLKPSFTLRFPAPKSDSCGGFDHKLKFSRSNTRLVKTAAFGNGSTSKSVRVLLHNDAFVEDSSTAFPSQLMAQHFHATLNRMSKWVITAILMAVVVWKNDVESLWAAMGYVINYIICVTLKRILKQKRPVSTLKSDPGMPSSHAQSVFYTLSVSIFTVIQRLGINQFTFTIIALALACGSYLCWLRVWQQFHTRSQVIVGAVVGSIFSIIWLWSWHSLVFQAFISFRWVRAIVISGAATYFLGLPLHLLGHCINTNNQI